MLEIAGSFHSDGFMEATFEWAHDYQYCIEAGASAEYLQQKICYMLLVVGCWRASARTAAISWGYTQEELRADMRAISALEAELLRLKYAS